MMYTRHEEFLPMLLCEFDLSNGTGSDCFGGEDDATSAVSCSFISITYILLQSGHLTPATETKKTMRKFEKFETDS